MGLADHESHITADGPRNSIHALLLEARGRSLPRDATGGGSRLYHSAEMRCNIPSMYSRAFRVRREQLANVQQQGDCRHMQEPRCGQQ